MATTSDKIPPFDRIAFVSPENMRHINQAIAQINSNALQGTGVSQGAMGTIINDTWVSGVQQYIWGKIVNAGPNGEADYSNAQYWVQLVCGSFAGTDTQVTAVDTIDEGLITSGTNDVPSIFTVTNRNEINSTSTCESGCPQTHLLPTDGSWEVICFLFEIPTGTDDDPSDPVQIWNMWVTPPLPPANTQYQVLQILDTKCPGTPGWAFPRFHN